MDKHNYIHYFSVLKILAMLAVICLHSFVTPINFYRDYLSQAEIFIGVFISQFLIAWAVPVFIMVSGALFLDKNKSITIHKLYGKYILRLCLILLLFGTLYSLMELVFLEKSISFSLIISALKNMYSGKSWAHMWFIYMIIGLYIVTPFLKIFISNADDKNIRYFLVILFIFTCFVPLINEITGVKFGIYIPLNSIYLFYFILGYALHNDIVKIDIKLSIIFIVLGILWCSIGQFIPTILVFESEVNIKYLNFLGVFLASGIFSLAKLKCKSVTNYVDTKLVPLSLGIYIVHQVFLNIFYKVLHITPDNYNIWFCWLFIFSMTTICSIILVWLLRKIPFVKNWIL